MAATDLLQSKIQQQPTIYAYELVGVPSHPGGNYLEGNRFSERFDWKRTLGPIETRPGHRSPWNYWSTDGMGLLENTFLKEKRG